MFRDVYVLPPNPFQARSILGQLRYFLNVTINWWLHVVSKWKQLDHRFELSYVEYATKYCILYS